MPALALARALLAAVTQRDEAQVRALTRASRRASQAAWIPREVRQEALAIVRLPRGRERFPTELMRFLGLLEKLAGYEEAPDALTEGTNFDSPGAA